MSALAPIRRRVIVGADPELAFEVFTDRIGEWWPVERHSVHGEGSWVAFEDGRIVERSATDGSQSVWGTVMTWEPPGRLSFTWHPGRGADRASTVSVTFEGDEDRTVVTLEHTGWEAFADPEQARDEYNHGWPVVLDRYLRLSSPSSTWVALLHRPGPAAAEAPSVFAHPLFAEHVAWLGRMSGAGYLVAAGPLGSRSVNLDGAGAGSGADASEGSGAGDGMTVLRLPGIERVEEAAALANADDRSVAGGLFTVEVRPWQVMMAVDI